MVNSLQLVFENTFIQILFDEAHKLIILNWQGNSSSSQIQQGLEEALLIIEEKECHKLISDTSLVTNSWNTANDWIARTWQPKAIKAGLRKVAFVAPTSISTKLSLERLVDKLVKQQGMLASHIQIFSTLEEAKVWFKH